MDDIKYFSEETYGQVAMRTGDALVSQLLWLIDLRWVAIWGIVAVVLIARYAIGAVTSVYPIYEFHVIIAAIILPVRLSFSVGLTAVLLYGALAVNELTGGRWLGHHPLEFVTASGLWGNPAYVLGACVAFGCTVMLAQYLTRIIITRNLVTELDGSIRIESEPGKGTSVIIQVPVRPRAELLVGRGQDDRGGVRTDVR